MYMGALGKPFAPRVEGRGGGGGGGGAHGVSEPPSSAVSAAAGWSGRGPRQAHTVLGSIRAGDGGEPTAGPLPSRTQAAWTSPATDAFPSHHPSPATNLHVAGAPLGAVGFEAHSRLDGPSEVADAPLATLAATAGGLADAAIANGKGQHGQSSDGDGSNHCSASGGEGSVEDVSLGLTPLLTPNFSADLMTEIGGRAEAAACWTTRGAASHAPGENGGADGMGLRKDSFSAVGATGGDGASAMFKRKRGSATVEGGGKDISRLVRNSAPRVLDSERLSGKANGS